MLPSVSGSRRFCGFALSIACAAFLAACGGPVGDYPPPPPPYEPPAAAMAKASEPKFQPLIKALVAQRKTAQQLAALNAASGGPMNEEQQAKYKELFGKVLEASQKVGAMVRDAQLTAEEQAAWNAISALDDARLEALVK
jgi:hypothetical protein